MGKEKAGFLTPKAIANRIKAKGLQKLRWYCQMCQKQCRDENGFKCHLMSESHQRQLILFADNPDEYIDTFSKEFLDGYIELLSRQYGTKRVQANVVYQEYIHDRDHVHMNSTQWETLTEFVKWLGREGHCVVDETEKGWFVAYIDRNWEAIKKQESLQKKEKMELDDDERAARIIEKQIERDRLAGTSKPQAEATELLRENDEEKIAFNLGITAAKKVDLPKSSVPTNALGKLKEDKKIAAKDSKSIIAGQKRKSALDELKEEEEQTKEKKNRKDYWLHTGIVVKVITKRLGDKYYKKKGVIKEVTDKYTGIVKLIDSGDKIKFDQEHLETVIPALGKSVLIVNGAYRGCEAKLDKLNEKNFSCSVTIKSGLLTGRFVEGIKYEDLSKLYQS